VQRKQIVGHERNQRDDSRAGGPDVAVVGRRRRRARAEERKRQERRRQAKKHWASFGLTSAPASAARLPARAFKEEAGRASNAVSRSLRAGSRFDAGTVAPL
jgi:hypothetical protein